MFVIKFLLLITIASNACLALDDLDNYFLNGECDKFNDAVARSRDWNVKRNKMVTLIAHNYKGDLKMADNIYNCLSKMDEGTIFEVDENMMRGYLALYRVLDLESQKATNVALKAAISMSKIAPKLTHKFQSPDLEILEGYLSEFKLELLPSVKTLCFDKWVQIKHPENSWYLAIRDGKVDMWPLNAHVITDNGLKWYVEREYRTDTYGDPVIDVTFKNAQNNKQLASNDKGEVIATSTTKGNYHWWTAELVELQGDDVGRFRFKNKQTGKYLRSDGYRDVTADGQNYNVLSMTTHTSLAINLILH